MRGVVARPAQRNRCPPSKYRERVSVGNRWKPEQRSNRSRAAVRSVSAPRGNYPFRTFKRKPVANTNAARRGCVDRASKSRTTSGRKRAREETARRSEGNGAAGLARRRTGEPTRVARARKGRDGGGVARLWSAPVWEGVIRVKLGSPWFPWIPAGYLRRGSTRGRTNERTDGRTEREDAAERQPATARVSSDASPHLSVRI